MTVRQLLASITSAELSEWMAYGRIEDWAGRIADWRGAALYAATLNAHFDMKGSPAKAEDYISFRQIREPQSVETQKAMMGVLTALGKAKKE